MIRKKSLSYFLDFHRRSVFEVRDAIVQDRWESMAVVKDFNIYFLKEFSFLAEQRRKSASKQGGDGDAVSMSTSTSTRTDKSAQD